MAHATDYCYMCEDSINPFLKCPICSQPFVDPVINTNGNRACRGCISSGPVVPVEEKLLHRMLDELLVECVKCHEKNIRRGNFQEHRSNVCPQRIVSCVAADLKCSWTGRFEQLDLHLQTCPFEVLRPIFTEIFTRIQSNQNDQPLVNAERSSNEEQSVEYRREFDEFKKEVELLRAQRNELQNNIHQLAHHSMSGFQKQEVDQTKQIEQLTKLYHEQVKRTNELQAEIQLLRRQFLQHVPLCLKLQTEFNQFKESMDQNQEVQQLKEQYDQLQIETKQLAEQLTIHQIPADDQTETDEIINIKQLLNEHDVQIKLLARKKCVIAAPSSAAEPELEKIIDKFLNNSEVDLDGKQLNDSHMDVVCRKGIMEKKAFKLRLQKNKITGKGAAILANALYNNTTLTEFYLSKNQIGDIGVHALAQILSVNNSTLKVLDLYSNFITDEGVNYLAEMLKINKTVIRLGLGFNQITDQGIRSLANTITHFNKNLQWLSLSSNKLISDKSIPSFIEILTCNSSLKTLWVNDCSLSASASVRLKEVKTNEHFVLEV